jgi:hypothetical protein
MMHLVDIPVGHESAFYQTVVPLLTSVVKNLLQDFVFSVRAKVKNRKSVGVIIDGGWSHPGWWAKEHTVIALDDELGLPLAYKHVIKGQNYFGSSRGKVVDGFFHVDYLHFLFMDEFNLLGMEGWGVKQIMIELKQSGLTVTRLTHDKDASTFKNVLEVFEDVAESYCASMLLL